MNKSIRFTRYLIISFQFLVLISYINSQSINPDSIAYRYWIYFKDKGKYKPGIKLEEGNEAYTLALSNLSDKAIERRIKVLGKDNIVSYNDLPVIQAYIDEITNKGVKINAVSRWLNGVSITVKKKTLDEIMNLGFVKEIEGVHFLEDVYFKSILKANYINYKAISDISLKYNYGLSFWQNEQINVPVLHNCGITGWGVTIGMCDAGFNWRKHKALQTRQVLGEYDWIFGDDSTQNQDSPNQFPPDKYDQDGHGTATFSTIGGFYPGQLIGPAFNSSFYLSKTEDGRSETPVEEDYWLEGVEWMEAQGIDVFSSSLIYKPYDLPNNSYDYKDMDGKTTIVVRAAENLAHLGVVVCNSMGNEHQTVPPSIVSPPDGDSVISVGAVDSAGVIADFSSNGPTSDGRMKPDIVAMGVDDWVASSESITGDDSTFSYSSGTSFSCPLTAGVCALILSAHPELTAMQVKEALKMTANNKDNPNNVYGWGLINAYNAVLYFGMTMSNKPEIEIHNDVTSISTYVISKNYIDAENVKVFYSSDGVNFTSSPMQLTQKIDSLNSGRYSVNIKTDFDVLKLYFSAEDSREKINYPNNAPEKFFIFNKNDSQISLY